VNHYEGIHQNNHNATKAKACFGLVKDAKPWQGEVDDGGFPCTILSRDYTLALPSSTERGMAALIFVLSTSGKNISQRIPLRNALHVSEVWHQISRMLSVDGAC
jgi:hypothetical protein